MTAKARQIFDRVIAAMQAADEIWASLSDEEYIALMDAIAVEALRRSVFVEKNRE